MVNGRLVKEGYSDEMETSRHIIGVVPAKAGNQRVIFRLWKVEVPTHIFAKLFPVGMGPGLRRDDARR
jgi:hypothetical protein